MPTYPLDRGAAAADDSPMFVRCKRRFKDGKEHRYWSVVENVRVRGGRVVQRHALYLGEINDSQRAAWCRSVEVLEGKSGSRQMALFPEDREAPELACEVVRIAVKDVELRDPRQWGACWLALVLWDRLDLDRFWGPRLPPSRQGTRWLDILKILACYRLIDPGSEWRLHRHWYEHSALRDLLGCDRAIADDTLYRCLDKLLAHKQAFFSYLRGRWAALFDARFDVLLYDLTSTYFESDPRFEDKRRFGYPPFIRAVADGVSAPSPIPLSAGAAFRRRGPSPGRRLSALVAVRPLATRPSFGRVRPDWSSTASTQASLTPDGTRPVSENRHSAMSSLRASATIITRRMRPRAPAVRPRNHSLSALSG